MAATMAQIREGLRVRLATIAGLHTYAYMAPRPEPPAACVLPSRGEFNKTFSSDDTTYQFDIWAYVSPSDLVDAQAKIDEYMAPSGAKSLRAAIDGDLTLGGVVASTTVVGWTNYATLLDVAGSQLLGAYLNVVVEA